MDDAYPFEPSPSLLAKTTPGDNAVDLITSYLILNLNEPCKLRDVSWIKPGQFMGVWWEMHLGRKTWESGAKHGATSDTGLSGPASHATALVLAR